MNIYQKQILFPLYKNAMFNLAKDGRQPLIKRAFPFGDPNPFRVYRDYESTGSSPSGSSSSSASGTASGTPPAHGSAPSAGGIDREALVNFLKERFPGLAAGGGGAAAAAAAAAGGGGGRRIIRRYGAPPRRRRGFRMEMGNMRMGDFFDDGPRRRRRRPRYYEEEIIEPGGGAAAAAAAAAGGGGGGFNKDEFFAALDEWLAAHPGTPAPAPAPTPTPDPAPTPTPAPDLRYTDDDLARRKAEIDADAARNRRWMESADSEINSEIEARDANRKAWKRYRNYAPMVSFGGAALGGFGATKLYDWITGKTGITGAKPRSWGDWLLRTGIGALGAGAGLYAGHTINKRFLEPRENLSETPIPHR